MGEREHRAGLRVRDAAADDLDAVVALTQRRRAQLAAWQPEFWNPSADADLLHRMWLEYLIQSETPTRVVVDEDVICAFAVSVPQGGQTFVDDVAVAPGRGPDAGVRLLAAIPEHPALLCVPAGDAELHSAADAAGVSWVSSYWLLRTDPATHGEGVRLTRSGDPVDPALEAPAHTLWSGNPAAMAMEVWRGDGVVVASPPVAAPPIYDPGGPTCVIDRVQGVDRAALLDRAVRTAFDRGDVGVLVVADAGDHELLAALAADGWRHVVDVGRLAPVDTPSAR